MTIFELAAQLMAAAAVDPNVEVKLWDTETAEFVEITGASVVNHDPRFVCIDAQTGRLPRKDSENPFTYAHQDEPPAVIHPVIGVCVHCSGAATTHDAQGELSCFPCAYHTAN